MRRWRLALGAAVLALVAGSCASTDDWATTCWDDPSQAKCERQNVAAKEDLKRERSRGEQSRENRAKAKKSNKYSQAAKAAALNQARAKAKARKARLARAAAARTYLVTRVIDGDTLELGNGETVRLVGIDTPEVGECGFDRATQNLVDLALYKRVRLGISDEDRDHYGRLLRYVDVGPKDAGLRLIQNGNAIARYDSRDGYGYHPRENRYIQADQANKNFTCPKPAPAPQPRGFVASGGGGNCAPGYKPCIPPYPPDLDCADVNGPIYVTGSDPHGLDADGDGVACEWG